MRFSAAFRGFLFQTPQVGWRYVFWVAAAMYVIGALPFLAFYRGQVEPWNSGAGAVGKNKEKDVPLKDREANSEIN